MHNRMCMCVVHSSLRNHKISVHPKKHEVQPSKSKIVVHVYVKSVTRDTRQQCFRFNLLIFDTNNIYS